METVSALLAICAGNSPMTGEFPAQRPVTRSFDVFLDLRLNKRLRKQSWDWWFETPSCSLCRHCNAMGCLCCVCRRKLTSLWCHQTVFYAGSRIKILVNINKYKLNTGVNTPAGAGFVFTKSSRAFLLMSIRDGKLDGWYIQYIQWMRRTTDVS